MPALTHGRVKNGFNGYATKVKLPEGGVSSVQPIKYNGGQQPKRDFHSKHNAKINAPNALTNSVGVSAPIKRAIALRSTNGGAQQKCECLPTVTFSKPN